MKTLKVAGGFILLAAAVLGDTNSATVNRVMDSRDYRLTVSSAHGRPVPSVGTNLYAWRATVTCSVESAVTSGLTKWTSVGWSGSGSVPVSGASTNTGGIMLTGLVSSIVWNWNTNYWLEVVTSGSGSVSPTSSWRPAGIGSSLTLTATPSSDYKVKHWLVNGVVSAAGQKTLTITGITADTTVSVVFEKIKAMPWLNLLLE